MKVRVDSQKCVGHVMCVIACPDVFSLNEDTGHAEVDRETVPAVLEDDVRAAQESCPEEAVEIY